MVHQPFVAEMVMRREADGHGTRLRSVFRAGRYFPSPFMNSGSLVGGTRFFMRM